MTRLLCGALLVLLAASATAQVTNPRTIDFDHEDFAAVDGFVVGYFANPTATAPVQEAAFPKPATCAPCSGALPSRPTAFRTWYVAVRAVAGDVSSEWSERVPFVRAPEPPARVKVR